MTWASGEVALGFGGFGIYRFYLKSFGRDCLLKSGEVMDQLIITEEGEEAPKLNAPAPMRKTAPRETRI